MDEGYLYPKSLLPSFLPVFPRSAFVLCKTLLRREWAGRGWSFFAWWIYLLVMQGM